MRTTRGIYTKTILNGHPSSVISYIGGKAALISNIVPLITYAAQTYGLTHYYELCGGGARMLLNLPTGLFQQRVYNDLDRGLCTLFACLGDKSYLYDLMALLETLGVGEKVFLRAKHAREYEIRMWNKGFRLSQLDAAAYAFIVAMQSRASDCVNFNRSLVQDPGRLRSYNKRVRELDLFYSTLAGIEIYHEDCFRMLDHVEGRSDVFVYLDPPYVPDKMLGKKHYGDRTWVLADHEALVDKLLGTTLKVALSGYDNDLYNRLLEGNWKKFFLKNIFLSSGVVRGKRCDEYMWLNFDLPYSLLEQISHVDYTSY